MTTDDVVATSRPAAPPRPSRRRPWLSWAAGIGLVIAAWFVAWATPGDDVAQAPFAVEVPVGQQGVGRNIAATVTDVRRAAELHAGDWSAEGNWIIVDLDVSSVLSETGVLLNHAQLQADGIRFTASDRPDSLSGSPLAAGVPQSGSLAFELPADLTTGHARLELALGFDTRLDSMIVVPFELGELPVQAVDEMQETRWTTP